MSRRGIRVEHFIPGGILDTDHRHDVPHDRTCSRCRRKMGGDDEWLCFYANADTHVWLFCDRCDWSACDGQRPN